jgi:uroporphyrinogen-III synthase
MQGKFTHAILEGATVVITRPAGTSAAILKRVRALGGYALALPGLALRATPERLPRIASDAFDAWIFTSPAAVRFGVGVVPGRRTRVRAYAVGTGTARALARHGIRATIPADRADSEGVLALADLKRVRGQRIALVGAPGGRDGIAPTLRRRGANVEHIHVYQRMPPRLTRRHFKALAAAKDPLITLLSSSEALDNLVARLPPPLLARLRRQTIVVSSARLAGVARENGFETIVQARSAVPRDLLDAAASALARHRL